MAVKHETELYAPIKQHFEQQGYQIKGEVRGCDLVGMLPGQERPLIVEMKKTFNLALLLQGAARQKLSDQVYVAVERNRTKRGAVNQRWGELRELCVRLGLGLITVTFYKTKTPFVEVLCEPESADAKRTAGRSRRTRKQERLLAEFEARTGDYNVGGSTGRKLMTAYRQKALLLAAALHEAGEAAPAQLGRATGIGSAGTILYRDVYGWFSRVRRGRYRLTEQGVQSLQDYANVLEDIDSKKQRS
ncbi:DUF2161 family putative PD-(D/E)XK-type phosphodiesterase [Paenibacillus sp. JX-17]|uniref:DUF2161 family putative PD-(D/E)XK-type phosphodiesterase n=1 Tax=Paenibacillus lacisoli TaxID=3064525 RepID=A0ABT9CDP6_9BACL|nr:DUF2161 family putative PD-(D/E)XK-type phosphodiesterase [Paenibacillus sp. JX-17]MDO7907351.1 DUF2161 family putative PD-(D/E)XK-type phosphodiesterase [Paenibacillus sp. JX-17]